MTPTLEQQEAIESTSRLTFVVAGPGSGKTRTLIWRIEHLIRTGVHPSRIVAITFTNAAAREIEHRLGSVTLGYCGTLHGFMLRVIRNHGRSLGFKPNVAVMDDDDSEEFLKEIISDCRYRGTRKELEAEIAKGPPIPSDRLSKVGAVAAHYWTKLRERNVLTFDAILIIGEIIVRHVQIPNIEHILIDECQDSNPIDMKIYAALPGNKWFCGDPDQSIYSFRGADVGLCLNLIRAPDCHVVPLQANYRSGRAICAAAQSLIEHNLSRYAKQTISARDYDGDVYVACQPNPATEASFIGSNIISLTHRDATSFTEFAVLCRYNDDVKFYADFLRAAGIPVAEIARTELPEDWPKVRTLMRWLQNPHDDHAAYQWILASKGAEAAVHARQTAQESYSSINDCYLHLDPSSGVMQYLLATVSSASARRIGEAMANLPTVHTISDLVLELSRMETTTSVGFGVTVTTYHGAKGREWDCVFVPAFEQHIIPGSNAKDVEEKRRMAYVAITRARRTLFISYAKERVVIGEGFKPVAVRPSQFIGEIVVS